MQEMQEMQDRSYYKNDFRYHCRKYQRIKTSDNKDTIKRDD